MDELGKLVLKVVSKSSGPLEMGLLIIRLRVAAKETVPIADQQSYIQAHHVVMQLVEIGLLSRIAKPHASYLQLTDKAREALKEGSETR